MCGVLGSAAQAVPLTLSCLLWSPPRPSPGLPGHENKAEGSREDDAQLFLSQHRASSSTDQGNENRACVETRANPGAKSSWEQPPQYRNHGEQLTRMQ